MNAEEVRVYFYADSGPHGGWMDAGDQAVVHDGFGKPDIKRVPKALWDRYLRALDEFAEAEHEIENYKPARRVP